MRKSHHRPPPTSLLASTRFVVALCAAIAMVLGAMSVGGNSPVDHPPQTPSPLANNTGMLVQSGLPGEQEENSGRDDRATPSNPIKNAYANRQVPIIFNTQPPASGQIELPITPSAAKTLEVKLKLKPVETAITVPVPPLLEVETTVTTQPPETLLELKESGTSQQNTNDTSTEPETTPAPSDDEAKETATP